MTLTLQIMHFRFIIKSCYDSNIHLFLIWFNYRSIYCASVRELNSTKKSLNCFKQALTWGEEDMLTVRSPSDTINRRRICCQSWPQHSRSWPNLDSSILSPSHDSSSIPTPSTTKVELTIETNSTEAGNIFPEFPREMITHKTLKEIW